MPELCKLVDTVNAICEANDKLHISRLNPAKTEVTVRKELQEYVHGFIERLNLSKSFTVISPCERSEKV